MEDLGADWLDRGTEVAALEEGPPLLRLAEDDAFDWLDRGTEGPPLLRLADDDGNDWLEEYFPTRGCFRGGGGGGGLLAVRSIVSMSVSSKERLCGAILRRQSGNIGRNTKVYGMVPARVLG
jgi:hypothetical protein